MSHVTVSRTRGQQKDPSNCDIISFKDPFRRHGFVVTAAEERRQESVAVVVADSGRSLRNLSGCFIFTDIITTPNAYSITGNSHHISHGQRQEQERGQQEQHGASSVL